MKNVGWTIKEGTKIVASGTIAAENDRDALGKVLETAEVEHGPDRLYRISCGDLTTTSYGDEFARMGRVSAHGAEEELDEGGSGYLFTDIPFDYGLGRSTTEAERKRVSDWMLKCPAGGRHRWIPQGDATDKCDRCAKVRPIRPRPREVMEQCKHRYIDDGMYSKGRRLVCVICGRRRFETYGLHIPDFIKKPNGLTEIDNHVGELLKKKAELARQLGVPIEKIKVTPHSTQRKIELKYDPNA